MVFPFPSRKPTPKDTFKIVLEIFLITWRTWINLLRTKSSICPNDTGLVILLLQFVLNGSVFVFDYLVRMSPSAPSRVLPWAVLWRLREDWPHSKMGFANVIIRACLNLWESRYPWMSKNFKGNKRQLLASLSFFTFFQYQTTRKSFYAKLVILTWQFSVTWKSDRKTTTSRTKSVTIFVVQSSPKFPASIQFQLLTSTTIKINEISLNCARNYLWVFPYKLNVVSLQR